nr:MAG TPA: portal protein [Caudoviricetes sp.]
MFENLRKIFNLKTKRKIFDGFSHNSSVRGLSRVHTFYKGLTYDNTYPSISRIVNEFATIRPYAIDANGKPLQNVRVINKLYHPNQQMSSMDFREALALMALVHRKVYVLVWREENGEAQPGGYITPNNIAGFTFLEGASERIVGGKKSYQVGANEYSDKEVLEIYSGLDPYDLDSGYSPSNAAQKWACLDDYIAAYEAGLFENGAVPAGQFIITAVNAEEFNKIVDTLELAHRGAGRNNNVVYTHRPIDTATGKAVDAQIQWIPFAQSNKDLDLKELFEQANKKIDSIYGVPASIRGVNDNNTYASVRVDEQIFVKYTIKPLALKIWTRFTHELNRITGGLGYAITFDLDIPGVAEEEKLAAETKNIEVEMIIKLVDAGYSLDSAVDALNLSNSYKLLKISNTKPVIVNDKPEVDSGGEVSSAPDAQSLKKVNQPIQLCNCATCQKRQAHGGHCLKVDTKIKSTDSIEERQIEQILEKLINDKVERALTSQKASNKPDETLSEQLEAILMGLLLTYGVSQFAVGVSLLISAGIDVAKLAGYIISDKLKRQYHKHAIEALKEFNQGTDQSIKRLVEIAKKNDWDKEMLKETMRQIVNTDRWRIQRFARTEVHRARGIAGVDAMVQVQNGAKVRITKEWYTVSDEPCPWCQKMNGKRVNVTQSYLKAGAAISKSKQDEELFVNNYMDIDTASLHPNCSCKERFIVEKTPPKEKFKPVLSYDEVKQAGKFIPSAAKHDRIDANEQKFIEDFVRLGQTIERIPNDVGDVENGILPQPTNDFIWHDKGVEIELKALEVKNPKYKTVAKYIRDAAKQGKRNFMLHSGIKLKDKFLYQIREYNKRNPDNQLQKLWAVDERGLFELIDIDKQA